MNENKKSGINERAATAVAFQAEKDNMHSHMKYKKWPQLETTWKHFREQNKN